MKIRLASPELQVDSIVDGEGIRSVLWTQGCSHNCKGCHNPQTHSFDAGHLIEVKEILKQIDKLEGQSGVTLSGGDPMFQAGPCAIIAEHCHKKNLNVWCYTGFTYEKLLELSERNPDILKLLSNVDVLVDGKFILEQKSFDARFRGSKNQRVIDVPKSLETNKVCIREGYEPKEGIIIEKEELKEEFIAPRKKYLFI